MSSLTLFNSLGSMPFLALFAVFLFIISAILIGIVTIWQFFQQKISNEISAHITKISDDISAHTTKIANDLSAHDTQTFNAELGKIYNLLQKSEKLRRVMMTSTKRRRKSYRWLAT